MQGEFAAAKRTLSEDHSVPDGVANGHSPDSSFLPVTSYRLAASHHRLQPHLDAAGAEELFCLKDRELAEMEDACRKHGIRFSLL